ncbi:MAG: type II secretion system protein GspK [Candidatus Omnitrophica bacterium]|nr:type II secretion system protein GspK [Candidatus Omnitrophota bacterium]
MDKKGSVLIISLWILTIISLFAIGLGHRSALILKIAEYQKDRLKAYYFARAGLQKAIAELQKDSNGYDSLDETWSTGKDSMGRPLFKNVEIQKDSGGSFSVQYLYDRTSEMYLCMSDEERRIHINGVSDFDKRKVKILLNTLQIDNAEELANTMVGWMDRNSLIPYAKKQELTVPEELLVVFEYFYKNQGLSEYKQKAMGTYEKIKDHISLYADNKMNINTASEDALTILIQAFLQINPLVPDIIDEAKRLAQRIIQARSSGIVFDKQDATEVIAKLNSSGPPLTSTQSDIITRLLNNYLTVQSNIFRIESIGMVNNTLRIINIIYDRQDKMILYWYEK